MSHPLAVALQHLRTFFARETLPPPPEEPGTGGARRAGISRLLFTVEPLPLEPPLPRRRRGLLRLLFAPEPLPREPARPPRRRNRWLAWLFLPERIGQDPIDPR